MFHKTRLGKFGESVPADQQGNVPEAGDDWRQMNWDLGGQDLDDPAVVAKLDSEWWPQTVQNAVRATAEARKKLDQWKAANASRIF